MKGGTWFECSQTAVKAAHKPTRANLTAHVRVIRFSVELFLLRIWFSERLQIGSLNLKLSSLQCEGGERKVNYVPGFTECALPRLVNRSSAVHCNLRRRSGRGRTHYIISSLRKQLQRQKKTKNIWSMCLKQCVGLSVSERWCGREATVKPRSFLSLGPPTCRLTGRLEPVNLLWSATRQTDGPHLTDRPYKPFIFPLS